MITRVNVSTGAFLDSGSLSNGNLPTFDFDPGAGDFVVVAIGGYKTSSADISFFPTLGDLPMASVGPIAWGNLTNSTNTSYFQWFVASGISSGPKTIAGTWDAAGFASPKLRVAAISYSAVGAYGDLVSDGGTEAGTALSQTIESATDRMIVQAFMHEPLGTEAITGYSQTAIIDPFSVTANCVGIVGEAPGAPSVTFTGVRVTGADYLSTAFELFPVGDTGASAGNFFQFFQ